MIKIGISPWVWAELVGKDEVALVNHASRLGFAGLEIAVLDRDALDVLAVRAALEESRVTPIVSTALPETRDLIHPNPDYQAAGQDFLRYCVDVAVSLGADRVIGPICAAPGRLWLADRAQQQREFDLAVRNLRPVAAYAAERGVQLALEVLNRYESSFINTVEAGLRLVQAVGDPALGLLLDTFHMNIEEKDVARAIRQAGGHIFHVHAIENDRGVPGSGSIDWAAVGGALHEVGYGGWVVIEGFSPQAEWLARAVCMWRPFAADMTLLASDGLAFLRAMLNARVAA